MKTYRIPLSDLTVSRIAYGCALLAAWDRRPLQADEVVKATRLVHTAYDHGITFFDLANYYSFHKAEIAFGQVLKLSPGLRHRIVIQSKCGVIIGDDTRPDGWFFPDCSETHIVSAVEDSLRRLGADYLDILLLHWPDILVRPQEVAAALEKLKRSGKVRHFGVSNHTVSQIERLRKAVEEPLVINQIHLSLGTSYLIAGGLAKLWNAARGMEDYTQLAATLDYCCANDMQVQAYSPLRGSLLKPPPEAAPEIKTAAAALAELAVKKGTNASAVALAWLLHHPAGIVPIVGSTTPEHLIENCAADTVSLTHEEWYRLLLSTLRTAPQKST